MGDIKNILLTGATGYLGSHLAKKFVGVGYNLFILTRSGSSLSKIEELIPGEKIFNIDVIDYDILFENNQIDAIIHTAASYGRKGETMVEVYDANVIFPIKLLEYALKYNVKYFVNSNTTLPPDLNIYALSKANFAQVLKMNSTRINVIDVELQYFYGSNDDVSKFVTFIMAKLNSGIDCIDLSPGTQVRDFIYIDDVTDAYLLLLQKATTFPSYQSVPLGTGIGLTIKSLTEKIKKALGNQNTILNFGALPLRTGEIMHAVADISFLSELGWQPRYDINEGLQETIKIEKNILYDSNWK
jgi:nucleoside-diphosphate-sugar epimerase